MLMKRKKQHSTAQHSTAHHFVLSLSLSLFLSFFLSSFRVAQLKPAKETLVSWEAIKTTNKNRSSSHLHFFEEAKTLLVKNKSSSRLFSPSFSPMGTSSSQTNSLHISKIFFRSFSSSSTHCRCRRGTFLQQATHLTRSRRSKRETSKKRMEFLLKRKEGKITKQHFWNYFEIFRLSVTSTFISRILWIFRAGARARFQCMNRKIIAAATALCL